MSPHADISIEMGKGVGAGDELHEVDTHRNVSRNPMSVVRERRPYVAVDERATRSVRPGDLELRSALVDSSTPPSRPVHRRNLTPEFFTSPSVILPRFSL